MPFIEMSGGGGQVDTNALKIIETIETDFWESFESGELADGMYQFQSAVLTVDEFMNNAQMFDSQFWGHDIGAVEYSDKYFVGNNSTDPDASGIVVVNKDGTDLVLIRFHASGLTSFVYSYVGRGGCGVGVDDNGNIYANAQGGAILAMDGNDPLNAGKYVDSYATSWRYIFHSRFGDNQTGAFSRGDSLAVSDGGIFAVVDEYNDSYMQNVLYCKDRRVMARSSGTYTFRSNSIGVDRDSSRLFAFRDKTLYSFDTDCAATSYLLPAASSITYSESSMCRLYVRNGYVLLFVAAVKNNSENAQYIAVFDTRTNTWLSCDENAQAAGSYNRNLSNSIIDVGGALFWSMFTDNAAVYIKWDYAVNSVSQLNLPRPTDPWRTPLLRVDEQTGKIMHAYKTDIGDARLDLIDPDTFAIDTFSKNVGSISVSSLAPLHSSNGKYYLMGYASNRYAVMVVDENGVMTLEHSSITSNLSTEQLYLTESADYIVVNQGGYYNDTCVAYNKRDGAVILFRERESERYFVPVIRHGDGFIYYYPTGLHKVGTEVVWETRIVSKGRLVA